MAIQNDPSYYQPNIQVKKQNIVKTSKISDFIAKSSLVVDFSWYGRNKSFLAQ